MGLETESTTKEINTYVLLVSSGRGEGEKGNKLEVLGCPWKTWFDMFYCFPGC